MIRRQSLRPRQIDIHSRLLIVRSDEDLAVDDDSGQATNIASLEDLSMSQDDVGPRMKKKKNIPIPQVTNVKSYEKDVPADYNIPTSYIRWQTVPQEEDEDKCDLDLEIEDMIWLREHPKHGENGDPRYQLRLSVFERMLDILEKASGPIYPNLVSQAEAEELFSKFLSMKKTPQNKCTVDVYNYWVQRRQKMRKSLLRKFWPQTPINDTNPHLVFRPREKERYKLRKHRKNDMEGYRKMQQLRQDFEQVRVMLHLIKKRERAKRMLVSYLDEILRFTVRDTIAANTKKSRKDMDNEIDEVIRKLKIPHVGYDDDRTKKLSKRKNIKMPHGGGLTDTPGRAKGNFIPEPIKVPTFMEYQPNKDLIFEEPSVPFFRTYPRFCTDKDRQPIGSSQIRLRCRARIGRGARVIIDRIPAVCTNQVAVVEEFARPSVLQPVINRGVEANVTNGNDPATPAASTGTTTSAGPLEKTDASATNIAGSISRKRLFDIYSMSDSEDEFTDPSAQALQYLDTKPPDANPARTIKYRLEI